VTKAGLMEAVWPETAVTENSLAQASGKRSLSSRRMQRDSGRLVASRRSRHIRRYVITGPTMRTHDTIPLLRPKLVADPEMRFLQLITPGARIWSTERKAFRWLNREWKGGKCPRVRCTDLGS
jgi:hypothetical protein